MPVGDVLHDGGDVGIEDVRQLLRGGCEQGPELGVEEGQLPEPRHRLLTPQPVAQARPEPCPLDRRCAQPPERREVRTVGFRDRRRAYVAEVHAADRPILVDQRDDHGRSAVDGGRRDARIALADLLGVAQDQRLAEAHRLGHRDRVVDVERRPVPNDVGAEAEGRHGPYRPAVGIEQSNDAATRSEASEALARGDVRDLFRSEGAPERRGRRREPLRTGDGVLGRASGRALGRQERDVLARRLLDGGPAVAHQLAEAGDRDALDDEQGERDLVGLGRDARQPERLAEDDAHEQRRHDGRQDTRRDPAGDRGDGDRELERKERGGRVQQLGGGERHGPGRRHDDQRQAVVAQATRRPATGRARALDRFHAHERTVQPERPGSGLRNELAITRPAFDFGPQ